MLTPAEVFQRERALSAPFDLRLAGGETVRVDALLRLLPGRRLTARVTRGGTTQLMKLFASRRERARELRGLAALAAAAIPAPRLLHALPGAVFISYIDGARTLARCMHEPADREPLLRQALALLERLHAAGLVHADPHFDNFLVTDDGTIHLVDAGAIRPRRWWVLHQADRALFCSQLPLAARAPLWIALGADAASLRAAIERSDRWRARWLAAKSTRNCSEFAAERSWRRRCVLRRDHDGAALRAILADPDRALQAGASLKDGYSATVARIDCAGRTLVLKRYNIKHWRHALARALQHTRAWRAWCNAARLRSLGIATPLPVAVLERRWGPLRSTAYLLTEYVEGVPLTAALDDASVWSRVARELRLLFDALAVLRRSHGDCKASNFLCDAQRVWTLDLDGMRRRFGALRMRRALARDRARLLRNFDAPAAARLGTLLDQEPETS